MRVLLAALLLVACSSAPAEEPVEPIDPERWREVAKLWEENALMCVGLLRECEQRCPDPNIDYLGDFR